jgi:hypothetical protein
VQCHTEAMDLMDMALKHPIIHVPVCTRSIVGHSMVLFSAQAVEASPGEEVVAECSAAGEDSVVGGGNVECMGEPRRKKGGQPPPQVGSQSQPPRTQNTVRTKLYENFGSWARVKKPVWLRRGISP